MLTNSESSRGTLTSSAHQLLCAPGTHIASGKDAFNARLEVDTGHNKSLRIDLDHIFEMFAVWRQSNEYKDACRMQFFDLARFCVLDHYSIHAVVLPFELKHLRIETHLHLR